MHFGRLSVQFVTKVRRICANVSRVTAGSYTKLHESRMFVSVSVPPELASPVLAGAVADVKRLARSLGRKSNGAEKRSVFPLPADNLNVVLDKSRARIDEVARQLAAGAVRISETTLRSTMLFASRCVADAFACGTFCSPVLFARGTFCSPVEPRKGELAVVETSDYEGPPWVPVGIVEIAELVDGVSVSVTMRTGTCVAASPSRVTRSATKNPFTRRLDNRAA